MAVEAFVTASFCNSCKSFSFCDCMSFCNGSRRFSFCDCLIFFDRLSFRFCDCLLFEHSFSAFVFNSMRFLTDFWAFVFGVRFWLHEFSASVFNCMRFCDFFLFEHSFSTFVSGLMSFCDWFLYERSNLVWWTLISATKTKGRISQCCLPFFHFGQLKTVASDPICLSTYVYRNEFDYLLKVFLPLFLVRTKD